MVTRPLATPGALVKSLAGEGVGPAAIARELGMARSSVYRLLEEAVKRRA